jgi:redox-sensitive bicupin YhaK (pirin superfamily)
MEIRKIKKLFPSRHTMEGAGVHLKRAFANREIPMFDPFLLLDAFGSDNPSDYMKGFPWHPHRGIETITYMLEGSVEHGDSMGNKGVISTGDIQWMTAGSGIIHQEMPLASSNGRMYGFQVWANLPARDKMMRPRYQDIKSSQIKEVLFDNGVKAKVICGTMEGTTGPVTDIMSEPEYFDIYMPAGKTFSHKTTKGHTAFIYLYNGNCLTDNTVIDKDTAVLFDDGDTITITTQNEDAKFILLSGKPLNEPIAWGGPIVMNTDEELQQAFEELDEGTFIK